MNVMIRTFIAAASLALLASCAATGESTTEEQQTTQDAAAQPGITAQPGQEAYSYGYGPVSYTHLSCTLRIVMTGSGAVTDVQIVQSSGDTAFDNSAIAAVQKASPLPTPSDPDVLAKFRTFNFRFKPGG